MPRNYTLAFEPAIEGGSVSLLEGEREINFLAGGERNSKAEDLLEKVQKLLNASQVEKTDVELIAVSAGPGSYTGIRSGTAIALGLKRALKCKLIGVSVLEALTLRAPRVGRVLTAVPFGRGRISWQIFRFPDSRFGGASEAAELINEISFLKKIEEADYDSAVVHPKIYDTLALYGKATDKNIIINSEDNLAYLIGALGHRKAALNASDNVKLIYPLSADYK